MTNCFSCGTALILEHDEDGWDLNHWTNLHGDVYCDQCFYELFTVPNEKATDNLCHKDKRVRERAKKTLDRLYSIWGVR